ncbi:hypothetical protein D3C86_1969190 [compost metagenome]
MVEIFPEKERWDAGRQDAAPRQPAYLAASLLMAWIRSLPMRPSMSFWTGSSTLRHSACSLALRV